MVTKTFTTSTKPVRTKSFTTSTLFVQDLGEYRGAGYTADRDALVGKKALDTYHNVETNEHQYYTGSAWVASGHKVVAENAGVEKRYIFATAGAWRVEVGDATYPIRYWDGTNTNFYVDASGDAFFAGDVILTGGGAFKTAASGTRWELVSSTSSDILGYVDTFDTPAIIQASSTGGQAVLVLASPYDTGETAAAITLYGGTGGNTALKIATSKLSFFGGTPVAQSTITALVDSTGGSVNRNLAAVSGSGADVAINNNFADCAASINDILTALEALNLVL